MSTKDRVEVHVEDLEKWLDRASQLHHRCIAQMLEVFMESENHKDEFDIKGHCLDQKIWVDTLLKELREYHIN